MRFLPLLFATLVACSLIGCGNKDAAPAESTAGGTATNTPATTPNSTDASTTGATAGATSATNREGEIAGTWSLDTDSLKLELDPATIAKLEKAPGGKEAVVAEAERQMKEQMTAQLKDATWTFNADHTAAIKTAQKSGTGTWSLSGNDMTLTTTMQKDPVHFTLSEDGKQLTTETPIQESKVHMALKKG